LKFALAVWRGFIRIGVSGIGYQQVERQMGVRGIRGAITVDEDTPDQIRAAARELMEEILQRNQITNFDDVISAVFTTTHDLTSAFPAEAARAIGMSFVPLLCAQEIPVPGAMPRCLRILLHVNTNVSPRDIEHVYLRDAQRLRPDLKSAQ
jgi:chorismate mutase